MAADLPVNPGQGLSNGAPQTGAGPLSPPSPNGTAHRAGLLPREFAVEKHEDRFRDLLERTDIIPWEADADTGRFTYVGPQAARILGYPVPQWYDANFWTAHLHPDDRERALDLCRRSCRKGEHLDCEYRTVAADGRTVWLRHLQATPGSSGRPGVLWGFLIDISERRRLVEELQERLRFETLFSDLSARFINLPADQVDREIEDGLRRLVEFLDLDRSTLFQHSADQKSLVVTHCWVVSGCEPLKRLLAAEEVPWALRKVLRGETIVFSSVEELPKEAARDKETLRRVGPKANVTFPLSAGGSEVFGALAFGKMTEERAWPESLIERLRLVAQVFANALERKRSEQKLQQALVEVRQFKDQLQQENVYLREEVRGSWDHEHIIGQSPPIQRVLAQAKQVAGTDASVLLLGETGTGKELLAAAIHNLSSRRDRTMVKVNCAALPATLVESELFGREKGAYTGALSKQVGRFELAHGSTIFLDEVGDLPPEVQVKLLRVLQEGTLEHLGSPRPIQVKVRVIAATNRDLAQAVREGRFREDLFYRLNVFPITLPPLRERRQDIPLLVWAFVEEFARTLGRTVRGIARESMEALQRYSWPGNVRELRNIVERALITSTGPTLRVPLPGLADCVANRSLALEDVEREHLLHVLELTGWRVRGPGGTAEVLRLKPTTLEARMAKLGIHRPSRPSDIS